MLLWLLFDTHQQLVETKETVHFPGFLPHTTNTKHVWKLPMNNNGTCYTIVTISWDQESGTMGYFTKCLGSTGISVLSVHINRFHCNKSTIELTLQASLEPVLQ